jgi:PAS domain S-box-containing protein
MTLEPQKKPAEERKGQSQLEAAHRNPQCEAAERQQGEAPLNARVQQQVMVAELGRRGLTSTDVDMLLNDAVALIAQALQVEFCEILELQGDDQTFRLRTGVGWQPGSEGRAMETDGRQSQAGYTLFSVDPVIVADLRTETRFTVPSLLHEHGVRSGMSVALRTKDGAFGVLSVYSVQRHAFTEDDLHNLQALADVLALALERCRMEEQTRQLIREQAARAAAEAAQARLAFLADVSMALETSLEDEATLEKLPQLAVPFLADWCMVDIFEANGSLRRLPVAHADPAKAEVARRLQTCGLAPQSTQLQTRVVRSGQSVLALEPSPEFLTGVSRDAEPLGPTRSPDNCPSMIVPLVARGQTLGVITLMAVQAGRCYAPADLALAEELARRCALALDNARLFQEARAAIRDKAESLAFLDTLLATAPVGIGFFDQELRYVRVNQALAAINGLPIEGHLGRTPLDVNPQLMPFLEPLRRQALDAGEPVVNVEVSGETLAAPGQRRHWLVSYYPVYAQGEVLGIGTVVVDITERQHMEERLQASLHEKEVLLKEIHHRVKNNLQIVSSLLDLQADALPDPQVRTIFEDSQQRIQAMALIHESLYQSEDLAHIDAASYMQRLCARLGQVHHLVAERVAVRVRAEAVRLEVQMAIACGLILQELLSNSYKHAFPDGRTGEIQITLEVGPRQQAILSVRDTGVGFPESLDFHTTDSLGLQLVYLLTEQLQGTITLTRREGTEWTLTFPLVGPSTREEEDHGANSHCGR